MQGKERGVHHASDEEKATSRVRSRNRVATQVTPTGGGISQGLGATEELKFRAGGRHGVLIVPSSCAKKEAEKEQRVSLCLLSVDSREAVCGLVSRPVLFPGLRQGSKATGNMVQDGSRTSTLALVAAQITDTNMASGGSTDHGHQHNLWCQCGPPSLWEA